MLHHALVGHVASLRVVPLRRHTGEVGAESPHLSMAGRHFLASACDLVVVGLGEAGEFGAELIHLLPAFRVALPAHEPELAAASLSHCCLPLRPGMGRAVRGCCACACSPRCRGLGVGSTICGRPLPPLRAWTRRTAALPPAPPRARSACRAYGARPVLPLRTSASQSVQSPDTAHAANCPLTQLCARKTCIPPAHLWCDSRSLRTHWAPPPVPARGRGTHVLSYPSEPGPDLV